MIVCGAKVEGRSTTTGPSLVRCSVPRRVWVECSMRSRRTSRTMWSCVVFWFVRPALYAQVGPLAVLLALGDVLVLGARPCWGGSVRTREVHNFLCLHTASMVHSAPLEIVHRDSRRPPSSGWSPALPGMTGCGLCTWLFLLSIAVLFLSARSAKVTEEASLSEDCASQNWRGSKYVWRRRGKALPDVWHWVRTY